MEVLLCIGSGRTDCVKPHFDIAQFGSLYFGFMHVRMMTAWLQGIQPCKCKGTGSNELGNQVFRLAEEEKKK